MGKWLQLANPFHFIQPNLQKELCGLIDWQIFFLLVGAHPCGVKDF